MGAKGDRRAEAGIGTSIIFIAMILTSSAAGSMVLGNMDSASQQAQGAFDGSLDMTADHLDVRSVVGVCDPEREQVIGLELLIALGAGSADINISTIVVELVLDDRHELLTIQDGLQAERVLSGGRTNSTSVIARGDIFELSLLLPPGVGRNDVIRLTILPAKGFPTSMMLTVPDTITATFMTLD